jgi:hypothetical protein
MMALASMLGAMCAPVWAADGVCQVTEIAPGVKMRAANCPTLIGRPAALQPNRVDNVMQPPTGLYRYSDVEMRVVPARGGRSLGSEAGPAPGGRRP